MLSTPVKEEKKKLHHISLWQLGGRMFFCILPHVKHSDSLSLLQISNYCSELHFVPLLMLGLSLATYS